MYSLLVSLDISTDSMTLAELSRPLGIEPSSGSVDRGTPRKGKRGGTVPHTVWRLFSTLPESAPLLHHAQNIFDRLPVAVLQRPGILPEDRHLCFTIGLFFDADRIAYPELRIPPACVDALDGAGIGIDITCYPYREPFPDEGQEDETGTE